MFIMQCIFGHKFPNAVNVVFLWVYTFIFIEEYLLSAYNLFVNVSSIYDFDMLMLFINAVVSIVLTVNFVTVLVNFIRSFRHESIRRTTGSCELKLFDEKLSGVAMNNDRALVNFEYEYNEIKEVYTYNERYNGKAIYNFVLVPKAGNELYLSLSGNITAREEIRYILKQLEKGEKPYPKKACIKCGFYLIDDRCPNCQKYVAV